MTRLEQLRLDAGLTPEQLSASLPRPVSGMTIRRIEAGKRAFPATLSVLAEFFDVPASDLCREALPVRNDLPAA